MVKVEADGGVAAGAGPLGGGNGELGMEDGRADRPAGRNEPKARAQTGNHRRRERLGAGREKVDETGRHGPAGSDRAHRTVDDTRRRAAPRREPQTGRENQDRIQLKANNSRQARLALPGLGEQPAIATAEVAEDVRGPEVEQSEDDVDRDERKPLPGSVDGSRSTIRTFESGDAEPRGRQHWSYA